MTTLTLTANPIVNPGDTNWSSHLNAGTVTAYDDPFSCGYVEFAPTRNENWLWVGWIDLSISAISATGTQQLVVECRERIFDVDRNVNVWSGEWVQRVVNARDGRTSSSIPLPNGIVPFEMTVSSTSNGILVAGHTYRLYIEVTKKRIVGSPTATVVVDDLTAFPDSSALAKAR